MKSRTVMYCLRLPVFLCFPLFCVCLSKAALAELVPPATESIPPAVTMPIAAPATTPVTAPVTPVASSTAQKLYALAQNDLLQLRVLLKNGRSQSTVGSGFLIGTSNLVITNFHVVSQIALEPETYFGEYKDTQGKSGALELLAVDVQHDLAVVRINRPGTGFFNLPENPTPLTQGEHLYSLGNPLDLGFTISEGTYNGLTHRGFSDQIMFTGPVNSGMSGGPNVNVNGEVAGVNVAHRRDGELVSFLVPARYAQALLASVINMTHSTLPATPANEGTQPTALTPRGNATQPGETIPPSNPAPETKTPAETTPANSAQIAIDFKPIIGQQLLAHQSLMIEKLLEKPLSIKVLGPYSVPVRESEQVRCWGNSDAKADKTYSTDQINCAMESAIFVSDDLQTGYIAIHHQFISSTKLNPLRFAVLMGKFFSNDVRGNTKDKTLTTPHCAEQFINNRNYTARAVLCVEAYQKFDDLYNFKLITATSDEALMNLQSSLELNGVSYANGQQFVTHFLASFDKESAK
jgi:serine protease Do